MSEAKRVQCPACKGVAFVKQNRIKDPFFTCSSCGPWNGRGPGFRAWCDGLTSLDRPPEPVPEPETAPGAKKEPEPMPEPVPETETTGDADLQDDWLEAWGRGE